VKRTRFITIAASPFAASIVPDGLRPEAPPQIYGDGVHDDYAAIQWRLDRGVRVDLRAKTIRLSRTLMIRQPSEFRMEMCHIILDRLT